MRGKEKIMVWPWSFVGGFVCIEHCLLPFSVVERAGQIGWEFRSIRKNDSVDSIGHEWFGRLLVWTTIL